VFVAFKKWERALCQGGKRRRRLAQTTKRGNLSKGSEKGSAFSGLIVLLKTRGAWPGQIGGGGVGNIPNTKGRFGPSQDRLGGLQFQKRFRKVIRKKISKKNGWAVSKRGGDDERHLPIGLCGTWTGEKRRTKSIEEKG